MASEAISSSILLIGSVVGAAFLITAILPAIFSTGDTFGTGASSSDSKINPDFRFVCTNAKYNPDVMTLWLKNVGNNQISIYDIQKSDIFNVLTCQIMGWTYTCIK